VIQIYLLFINQQLHFILNLEAFKFVIQIILVIFSFLIPLTDYLALPRKYLSDDTGENEVVVF